MLSKITWMRMTSSDLMLKKLKKRLLSKISKRSLTLERVQLDLKLASILLSLTPGLLASRPLMDSSLVDLLTKSKELKLHKSISLISSRRKMIRRNKLLRKLELLKLSKSLLRRRESSRKLLRLPRPRLSPIMRCLRMSMMTSRTSTVTLWQNLAQLRPRKRLLRKLNLNQSLLRLQSQSRKHQRLRQLQLRLQSQLLRNRPQRPK